MPLTIEGLKHEVFLLCANVLRESLVISPPMGYGLIRIPIAG